MATNTLTSIKESLDCLPNILDGVSHLTPNKDDWKIALCKERDIIAETIFAVSENIGDIHTTSITLTANQIRAIHTTPVQVLPALPSGSYYEILSGIATYKYGTSTFSTANWFGFTLGFATTGGSVAMFGYNGYFPFITSTTDISSYVDRFSGVQAKGEAINVFGPTYYPVTGSSATGTVRIELTYRIATI